MPIIVNDQVKLDIISVDDDFVSVNPKTNLECDLKINFFFDLERSKLTKCFKVKVQCFSEQRLKTDKETSVLLRNDSIADSYTAIQRIGSTGNYNLSKLIFFTTVDLTKSINNSFSTKDGIRSELKIRNLKDDIVPTADRIEMEREVNEEFKAYSSPSLQQSYQDYISRGISPPELISESFDNNEIKRKIYGTNFTNKMYDSLTKRLTLNFKRDKPANALSQVIDFEKSKWFNANRTLTLPSNLLKSGMLYFYFEVFNSKGDIVQTVEKKKNLDQVFRILSTPMSAPKIRGGLVNKMGVQYAQYSSTGNTVNETKLQIDNSFVELKTVNRTLTFTNPLIGQYSNGVVFSSNEEKHGNDFSSSIVVDRRFKNNVGCVMASQPNPGQFKIRAYRLHPKTVSVIFYYRNLTFTNRIKYKISNDHIGVSKGTNPSTSFIGTHGHIYEFFAESYLSDGSIVKTSSDIVESFRPTTVSFDFSVLNQQIGTDDVSFELQPDIKDESIDQIVTLLKQRGYENYFNNQTQDKINEIKKFIGFIVYRFNISTGKRDYMGEVLNNFSDSRQCDLIGAQKFTAGNQYEYEIFPTYIDPASMYDNQIEKKYSTNLDSNWLANNSKFKQLLSIRHSTLFSKNGLSSKFSSNLLSANVIGNSKIISISSKKDNVTLTNLSVVETLKLDNKFHCVLNWNFTGNAEYFLISRCLNGRHINTIGKIHVLQSSNNVYRFIDITDVCGNITYQILPVFNDGTVGTVSSTNVFISG